MKKLLSLILALTLCLSLCACAGGSAGTSTTVATDPTHTHDWNAANCTNPKTCKTCGATEGNAAGHNWQDATCEAPKTCKNCGATEGNAASHNWQEVTCESPKTCKSCGKTEGSAKGHSWQDATCSKPATCKLCGATSGSALNHNFQGGNCQTPASCTYCGQKSSQKADHSYYGGKCSVCGATNERYDKIKSALKSVERYPKYIKINYDLIDNEYDLFKMTSNAKYYSDAHKHCLEVHDYLQKIIDKCEDYKELDMLTDDCRDLLLEMPTVPTSASTSSMRSYISSARSYVRKCKDVIIIYNVLADDYELPAIEY